MSRQSENIKQIKYYGYIEGWLSIGINLVLFVLKYWVGVISGSIAIIADAWHSLSDSLTSVVVIIGTKISSAPADKEHPFGHGRAELIGSVVIGVLLAVVAGNFIIKSIEKLMSKESAEYGTIAVVAVAVSIVAKEILAQFSIRAGKKIKSESLIADGWHHRSDSISSIIVLAGIFIGPYFWWIDAVLGIVVSLIIFYAVYEIMRNTVNSLIGEEPGEEFVEKICKLVDSRYPETLNIHHIHLHKYGYHSELTFHIRIPDAVSLHDSHEIVTDLEKIIMNEMGINATIHAEPLSHIPAQNSLR